LCAAGRRHVPRRDDRTDLVGAFRAREDRQPRAAECRGAVHLLWTPTLVAIDAHGAVLRTVIGFLPPAELAAELGLMEALWALRRGLPDRARALLQAVRRDHAGAAVVPEAHYWEGVAAYRQRHDKDDLWAVWRELLVAYPGPAWARRTTLVDPVLAL
jgi:hypothetical protein